MLPDKKEAAPARAAFLDALTHPNKNTEKVNSEVSLQIDREQIRRFHDALFPYVDAGTWISCRTFFDDGNGVFETQGVNTNNGDASLDGIIAAAERAAVSPRATVFCPPIATFNNPRSATEMELANGLALSVECDQRPQAARQKLESLLGSATLVVASGGEWVDPETGEVQNKVHLHWRLAEPTRDAESHALLKKARTLATALVGGDTSNKPIVHPIRWAGTWHRKKAPRLAQIVSESSHEIELGDAIERLGEALAAYGVVSNPIATIAGSVGKGAGESRETGNLVAEILSGRDYHAPLTALAMRYLLGGMPDAQVVLTLRGIMESIPENTRDLKDGSIQTGRWQARYDDIPRAVSTARGKICEPKQVITPSLLMSAADFPCPAPQRRWVVNGWIPEGNVTGLLAAGGSGKSLLMQQLGTVLAANFIENMKWGK